MTSNYKVLALGIYDHLKTALWRWGLCSSPDYAAFQPIVDLQLHIVEHQAILMSNDGLHHERVTDELRQMAVWQLLKDAIVALRPPASALSPSLQHALTELSTGCWPANALVAPEWTYYVVLTLAYVTKSYKNDALAELLHVAPRTLSNMRNRALLLMAERLARWEEGYEQGCRPLHDVSIAVQ